MTHSSATCNLYHVTCKRCFLCQHDTHSSTFHLPPSTLHLPPYTLHLLPYNFYLTPSTISLHPYHSTLYSSVTSPSYFKPYVSAAYLINPANSSLSARSINPSSSIFSLSNPLTTVSTAFHISDVSFAFDKLNK